jgi:hypothetical protein
MHRLKRGATDQKGSGRLHVIQRNSAQQGWHSARAPVPVIRLTFRKNKRAAYSCPHLLGSHSGDAEQVDALGNLLRLLLRRYAKRSVIVSAILIHQPSPANQPSQYIHVPFSYCPMYLQWSIVSFVFKRRLFMRYNIRKFPPGHRPTRRCIFRRNNLESPALQ